MTAPPQRAGLRVRKLGVRYQGIIRAVEGISLDVPEGTTCGVIGLNGAGKTTLLRALSGFLRSERVDVASDEVSLDGVNIAGLSPGRAARQGIVMVAERDKVFASLTVAENLALALSRHARSAGQKQAVLDETYERFPILKARVAQTAGLLSGGERQMLALAAAIIMQPRLLLLDEPSLGLSPSMVMEVENTVRRIVSERRIICVIADQNAGLVAAVSQQTHLLVHGRITPQDDARLNDRAVTAVLLGSRVGDAVK